MKLSVTLLAGMSLLFPCPQKLVTLKDLYQACGLSHCVQNMREVVSRCLQKDPNKRPTASQLLEHRFFKVRCFLKYHTLFAWLECALSRRTTVGLHSVTAFFMVCTEVVPWIISHMCC